MGTFSLRSERIVLPGRVAAGYLPVRDGALGAWQASRPEGEVVDVGASWVAPGLVDTHIHGFWGHATTDCDAAGMLAASEELARRGTTSWLPTTFTESAEAIGCACEAIARAAEESEAQGAAWRGARIQGIYLEGPFFTERHVGAQNPAYLCDPSLRLLREWQRRARGRIVKSALAPERAGSVGYVAAAVAEGVVACVGHTDATYDEAVAAVDAGATCFVHTYNAMRGLHHRDPGVVGCAMTTPATFAELICDGHHVAPAAAAALVCAKGWDHVVPITDCLGCGGLPEGEYTSGGLPVVMRDGACYLRDKDALAGSVATLAECVRNLAAWGVVTPEQAIRMATEVAARSARVDGRCGLLVPGRPADLVVLSPALELEATYVGGARVA